MSDEAKCGALDESCGVKSSKRILMFAGFAAAIVCAALGIILNRESDTCIECVKAFLVFAGAMGGACVISDFSKKAAT
jgi:hypothetical protein